MRPLPPIEVLRARYTYDPDTGEVRHRQTGSGRRAGDLVAPAPTRKGYHQCDVRHEGVRYRVRLHRIAYALHHGADPYPYEIDHINRDTSDNRACNLRAVTPAANRANSASADRPVRITYPDGRGSIVCDSVSTAARVLRRPRRTVHDALRRPTGALLWAHPTLPHTYTPSGITLAYT